MGRRSSETVRNGIVVPRVNITDTLSGPSSFSGFPEFLDVKLKYVFFNNFNTTNASTAASTYTFRLNDTYDPDYTGAGHQPYLRDQLFQIYGRCVVYQTDYKVVGTTDSTKMMYLTTAVSRSATASTDQSTTAERPGVKFGIFQTAKPLTLRDRVDIADSMGELRSAVLTDDLFSQDDAATPSNVLYLHCSIADPTASGYGIYMHTELTMYCRFKRLKDVASS